MCGQQTDNGFASGIALKQLPLPLLTQPQPGLRVDIEEDFIDELGSLLRQPHLQRDRLAAIAAGMAHKYARHMRPSPADWSVNSITHKHFCRLSLSPEPVDDWDASWPRVSTMPTERSIFFLPGYRKQKSRFTQSIFMPYDAALVRGVDMADLVVRDVGHAAYRLVVGKGDLACAAIVRVEPVQRQCQPRKNVRPFAGIGNQTIH